MEGDRTAARGIRVSGESPAGAISCVREIRHHCVGHEASTSLAQVIRLAPEEVPGETLRSILLSLSARIQTLERSFDLGSARQKRLRREFHDLISVGLEVKTARSEMLEETHRKMLSTLNWTKTRIGKLEVALEQYEQGGDDASSNEAVTPPRDGDGEVPLQEESMGGVLNGVKRTGTPDTTCMASASQEQPAAAPASTNEGDVEESILRML
mmetsp:Transcript_24019/g.67546  ORF Transcript_24019/g.67546 Transcript_24019/m.67546 type:complete len:212 (+) Transcript_24019:341-976(+)